MKCLILLLGLLILGACSESNDEGYDVNGAQQEYNRMKGTYQGNVVVNNLPATVQIVIDKDFTVKNLPSYPILSRIFTGSELDAAESSLEKVTFVAETDQMLITDGYLLLTMHPGDLQFQVMVNGKAHDIVATFQARAYRNNLYGDLSVNMIASELYCDGVSYDLSQNGISYLVDSAKKQ